MKVSVVMANQPCSQNPPALQANERLRILIKLNDGEYRVEEVCDVEAAVGCCRQLGGSQWQLIGRYTPI